MRFLRSLPKLVAITIAVTLAFAAVTWQPVHAPAAAVVPINLTATDTLFVPEGFGGLSIQARSGDVGVRLLGGPFAAVNDSIGLPEGGWLNLDLYARLAVFPGKLISGLAVYISAGDTVRGIYW